MLGWSSRATASASFWNRRTSSADGNRRGPDHLQGHRAIQAELPGLVDDPHAAFAQDPQQLVVAEVSDARPLRQAGAGRAVIADVLRVIRDHRTATRGHGVDGRFVGVIPLGPLAGRAGGGRAGRHDGFAGIGAAAPVAASGC